METPISRASTAVTGSRPAGTGAVRWDTKLLRGAVGALATAAGRRGATEVTPAAHLVHLEHRRVPRAGGQRPPASRRRVSRVSSPGAVDRGPGSARALHRCRAAHPRTGANSTRFGRRQVDLQVAHSASRLGCRRQTRAGRLPRAGKLPAAGDTASTQSAYCPTGASSPIEDSIRARSPLRGGHLIFGQHRGMRGWRQRGLVLVGRDRCGGASRCRSSPASSAAGCAAPACRGAISRASFPQVVARHAGEHVVLGVPVSCASTGTT